MNFVSRVKGARAVRGLQLLRFLFVQGLGLDDGSVRVRRNCFEAFDPSTLLGPSLALLASPVDLLCKLLQFTVSAPGRSSDPPQPNFRREICKLQQTNCNKNGHTETQCPLLTGTPLLGSP